MPQTEQTLEHTAVDRPMRTSILGYAMADHSHGIRLCAKAFQPLTRTTPPYVCTDTFSVRISGFTPNCQNSQSLFIYKG